MQRSHGEQVDHPVFRVDLRPAQPSQVSSTCADSNRPRKCVRVVWLRTSPVCQSMQLTAGSLSGLQAQPTPHRQQPEPARRRQRGQARQQRDSQRERESLRHGPGTADELILPDILVLQLRQRAVAVGEHRSRGVPAPGLAVDAEARRLPKVGVAPCAKRKQPPPQTQELMSRQRATAFSSIQEILRMITKRVSKARRFG